MAGKCRTHQREKIHKDLLSEDLKGRDFVVYIGLYVMIILTVIKQFVQQFHLLKDNNSSCSVEDRHCNGA